MVRRDKSLHSAMTKAQIEEKTMEQGASTFPVMNTFVVRLWTERSATGSYWRGRIEHVQSRVGTTFSDVDGMLSFINRFVEIHQEKESAG